MNLDILTPVAGAVAALATGAFLVHQRLSWVAVLLVVALWGYAGWVSSTASGSDLAAAIGVLLLYAAAVAVAVGAAVTWVVRLMFGPP